MGLDNLSVCMCACVCLCERDADLVWPWELWLLNLEVDKSREGDAVENPGSETKKQPCKDI